MASALIVVVNEDLTAEGRAEYEKESEDKTNSTGTTKSWETHSANSSSAVTMKRPLSLEDIQLLDNDPQENQTTSHGIEPYTSCNAENGVVADEKPVANLQRRIGVVQATDTTICQRRNARVLQKKFGEVLVSEMPGIFNKKL
ncbi:hypothetical protein OS493_031216 [Desmophyllum pertusum]|nr:hypothetical protein OS493_031204 [Desmophyllum pertusum]KAJ7383044.1 hypothetical protein OS493_031214 [Desmophyllum pertusum]KAJ7383045.1 hypothetical protein OS493_031215 [Desmophyllum pertusum]KAJ7383046.1 hypothetical protein OS493_031216 [Desmophyllum pertusum]